MKLKDLQQAQQLSYLLSKNQKLIAALRASKGPARITVQSPTNRDQVAFELDTETVIALLLVEEKGIADQLRELGVDPSDA